MSRFRLKTETGNGPSLNLFPASLQIRDETTVCHKKQKRLHQAQQCSVPFGSQSQEADWINCTDSMKENARWHFPACGTESCTRSTQKIEKSVCNLSPTQTCYVHRAGPSLPSFQPSPFTWRPLQRPQSGGAQALSRTALWITTPLCWSNDFSRCRVRVNLVLV